MPKFQVPSAAFLSFSG